MIRTDDKEETVDTEPPPDVPPSDSLPAVIDRLPPDVRKAFDAQMGALAILKRNLSLQAENLKAAVEMFELMRAEIRDNAAAIKKLAATTEVALAPATPAPAAPVVQPATPAAPPVETAPVPALAPYRCSYCTMGYTADDAAKLRPLAGNNYGCRHCGGTVTPTA